MTENLVNRIGIVGIGVMGSAISTRLIECGQQLTIFNRTPEKIKPLVSKGARAAISPRDVAENSDIIILSLNNAAIVEEVVFGANGIAEAATSNKLLLDMSSIDPESTKAMAERLRAEYQMGWLDCPLSGGAPGALGGKLAVMAGGNEQDFEKARSVMDHLCANLTLMGPSGAGQTTKLVNQVLCAVGFQALAEATQLALNGGVDVERIPAALAGGRADSRLMQEFMAKMGRHDYSPTGRLDNMLKDLEAVQAFASKTGVSMPVTGLTTELHRMFVAAGKGGDDNAALMKFFNGPAE
ncbi:MAG: 2-hydroxy-3-oxopropionate reductase [Parasphingorhabdus sp.]|jgi:2-hydroxy-3-oxopropionate reductase